MEEDPKLTILSVNYNSSEFLCWNLRAWSRLTECPHRIRVIDNGSRPEEVARLRFDAPFYRNVDLSFRHQSTGGSIGHGEALNELFAEVETPYTAIFDADCIPLIRGWDRHFLEPLNEKVKIVGTPPLRNQKRKPIDFPLIYAIAFETQVFRDLKIDFRPEDAHGSKDTGWEIRSKLLDAGYEGHAFWCESTRIYQEGPFGHVICAEYYDGPERERLVCCHLGRGSTATSGKYGRGRPWDRFLERRRYTKQKGAWFDRVEEILWSESNLLAEKGDKRELRNQEERVSACPVCGGTDGGVVLSGNDLVNRIPGWWSVVRCPDCCHGWTSPRPTPAAMGHFYPESTAYYRERPVGVERSGLKARLLEQARRQHFGYHRETVAANLLWKLITLPVRSIYRRFLLPQFPSGNEGRLLEIGCATGTYLARMQELGWQVEGLEFSEAAAENARAKGLMVKSGSAERADYPEHSFDVVVMSMVLEHLHDPAGVIGKIRRWLKPGGQLLISVPDFSGWEARVFGQYAYSLQLPTHLSHFSPRSMKRLLTDWNLTILHQFLCRDWDHGVVQTTEARGKCRWSFLQRLPKRLRHLLLLPFQWCHGSSRMIVHARRR